MPNIFLALFLLLCGFWLGIFTMGFIWSSDGERFIAWYRHRRLCTAQRRLERAEQNYLDTQPDLDMDLGAEQDHSF